MYVNREFEEIFEKNKNYEKRENPVRFYALNYVILTFITPFYREEGDEEEEMKEEKRKEQYASGSINRKKSRQ
jgi:hypothetical protein